MHYSDTAHPLSVLALLRTATTRFLQQFAHDKFAALDAAHSGRLPVVAARTFVKSLCPGPEPQVADAISQFVAAAEGAERDVPPETVNVAAVTEIKLDAFVAGVCGAPQVGHGELAQVLSKGTHAG